MIGLVKFLAHIYGVYRLELGKTGEFNGRFEEQASDPSRIPIFIETVLS